MRWQVQARPAGQQARPAGLALVAEPPALALVARPDGLTHSSRVAVCLPEVPLRLAAGQLRPVVPLAALALAGQRRRLTRLLQAVVWVPVALAARRRAAQRPTSLGIRPPQPNPHSKPAARR
jgi:hypothetical protein